MMRDEMLSQILSFSKLDPLAASRMFPHKLSQVVHLVLHHPQSLAISPQLTIPLGLLLCPNIRTRLYPATGQRSLACWRAQDHFCHISIISPPNPSITFPLDTWTLLCMSIPQSILECGIKERIVVDMVQLIRMTEQEVVLVEGQLRKIIHAEGTGDFPQKGQEIFALYRGTLLDGTEFDSNQDRDSPFNFVLGQGRVIKGWDTGFASMRKGERATLICSPDYAYGARGSPPKIPANATLKFEVELLDFKDKKKEKWEYSDEEKVAEALKFKEAGNEHLKQGNAKAAADSYKEGIDFVEHETAADAKAIFKTLQLNIAQAYLKLNKNKEASQAAGKVLKDDPSNLKALYRRGVAYSKSQDFDRAQADFKELLKLDPQNAEAKKELASIATALRQFKEKEKKVFGGIFSKGGLYDDVKTTEIKPEVKKVESEDEDQEDEIKHPEEPAAEPSVEPTAVPAEEPMQEEKPVEGHLKTE